MESKSQEQHLMAKEGTDIDIDIDDEVNATLELDAVDEEEENAAEEEDDVDEEEEGEEEEEEYTFSEGTSSKKARGDDFSRASMAEIMEAMNFGACKKRSRKPKKRGRRERSWNKLNPKLTQMLGDATLHYACGQYDKAIAVLHEVVRLAPNLPESYHDLGLLYMNLRIARRARI